MLLSQFIYQVLLIPMVMIYSILLSWADGGAVGTGLTSWKLAVPQFESTLPEHTLTQLAKRSLYCKIEQIALGCTTDGSIYMHAYH